MRRASFRQTWLQFDVDLKGLQLEPFQAKLTAKQRFSYSFGALMLAALLLILVDVLAALFVAAAGLYVVWNPGNQVTRREKKVFVTTLLAAVYFGLLADMVVLFRAFLPWTFVFILALVVVWRK